MLGHLTESLLSFDQTYNYPRCLSMTIMGAQYGGNPPYQKNEKTIPVVCEHLTKTLMDN